MVESNIELELEIVDPESVLRPVVPANEEELEEVGGVEEPVVVVWVTGPTSVPDVKLESFGVVVVLWLTGLLVLLEEVEHGGMWFGTLVFVTIRDWVLVVFVPFNVVSCASFLARDMYRSLQTQKRNEERV